MTTKMDAPEGIGPHEFRELALMLLGKKPLAMFSDVIPPSFEWPEAEFQPHVNAGTFVKREEIYEPPEARLPLRCVYYALPSEVWRIEKLHEINAAIFGGIRELTDKDELETGRLLGYSEAQVKAFVDWIHRRRLKQEGV